MNVLGQETSRRLIRWLWLSVVLGCGWPVAGGAGELAGSGHHTLVLGAEPGVGYAWGANQAGQVGAAPGRDRAYPFRWAPGAAASAAAATAAGATGPVWTQVASGDWHSVALAADGTVWTWGQNGHGQLGDGTTTNREIPMPVPGLRAVIAVAAGTYHSLAVTADGRVWGWGNNDHLQLGNNSNAGSRTPALVVVRVLGDGVTRPDTYPPLTEVIAVATSAVHSVALKGDGTLWAWGDNAYGQLGTGSTLNAGTAQRVAGVSRVTRLIAGGWANTAYTLAVTEDGAFWGWGNNGHCQLGEAAWERQSTPQPLPNLNGLGALRALVGGAAHGAALTDAGQIWTWGHNQHGQLGDGTTTTPVCAPVAVPGLADVTALGAGAAHTLALRDDGTVWAWGQNGQHQLGDGSVDNRATPAPVLGVCNVGRLNLNAPPPAGCPLTLATAGDGTGTMDGAGEYAAGTAVTLTAVPDPGSRFDGWTPEPCAASFPMPDRALTCTARFTRVETVTYPLTLNPTGGGGGTVGGAGNYPAGTSITLTAEPDRHSAFLGWQPPCAAQFPMPAAPLTCTATFEPLPNLPLTVLKTGDGAVSGGGQYQVGETVTLRATPHETAHFAGWSPPPCAAVFTMPDEPLTCTATFVTDPDPTVLALLDHYYPAILDRAPDATEQTHWAGEAARMQELGIDLAEVVRHLTGQLFTGAEYRNQHTDDARYITDLHRTFLQRDPTAEELTTWTAALAAGLPRDVALYHFLFSPEFTAHMEGRLGAATSRPEVLTIVDFYRGLLGRLPDEGGFRYWLDRFQTAQCQGAAAVTAEVEAISHLFAHSTEYLNRQRTNRDYLQDLYNAFLRRGADVGGFNWWLDRLDRGDLTRDQTRRHFVAAPEFQERVGQIIARGCGRVAFAQVSAGGFHTCGIGKNDSEIVCWGANTDWNNVFIGQATPPTGTFTQVSAGREHTCGVRTDGVVECWGDDWSGRATPPAGTFTQVSAGELHTCGVRTDGAVECWGSNSFGQATPPAGTFTQISAGGYHTCGIGKNDSEIVCWGANTEWNNVFLGQATPPAGTFTQVSAGFWHTCGVRTDGAVECWGDDWSGRATSRAGTFTQVSAGQGHTCGVRSDGAVECWGGNQDGQATPPAGRFTQVSAGRRHTCGIRGDGAVECWGEWGGQTAPPAGTYYVHLQVTVTGSGTVTGQPGRLVCGMRCHENYAPHTVVTLTALPEVGWRFAHWSGACSGTVPTCQISMHAAQQVGAVFSRERTPASRYRQVSAGELHTCGIRSNGVVECWGGRWGGQTTPPPAGTFTQVSAGELHTCGVRTDGAVECWGSNTDLNNVFLGQATPPAGTFTQVSAGRRHTCGVRSDGAIECWGGNTDPNNVFLGQATPPAGTFTQVSAGLEHTCGVRSDGAVECWGGNRFGQATPPAGTFTQVSAGYHTCGVRIDSAVECWGNNWSGQATPPARIFTQISAGINHTCGVRTDGAVECWGWNQNGQANRPGGTFTQVSAGGFHTCGITVDETVVCWGSNEYGQSTPP